MKNQILIEKAISVNVEKNYHDVFLNHLLPEILISEEIMEIIIKRKHKIDNFDVKLNLINNYIRIYG
jgi:hypothetical protein